MSENIPVAPSAEPREAKEPKFDKQAILDELAAMLKDVNIIADRGPRNERLSRAHGYVDGYMRALMDTGICTRQQLLDMVNQARTKKAHTDTDMTDL